jgi:hypothetical protein
MKGEDIEINELISSEISKKNVPEEVKKAALEFLQFEIENWQQERTHYSEEYDRIVSNMIKTRIKGKD